jgi:CheY-like chemotaxis protein
MTGEGVLTLETRNLIVDGTTASVHKGVAPGEYVTITVSDTGVGIDPDQREHIFEPFFTTKPVGDGTGLGLSMVYGFTKRARGDVLVESEPGRGTLVRLYFPRSAAAPTESHKPAESPGKAPGGNETILVVDDEEDLAMLAKTGLSRLGYRVLTAGNAQQAMKILAAHPTVDLLFTDLAMPGKMDGVSLAETATRKFPGLKVLLASGYSEQADSSRLLRYRQSLVPKPYRIAELAARIRDALDKEAGA